MEVKIAEQSVHSSPAARALPPRERILIAARELFARHGVHGVGVEAVAEAAGTNKMTLYRHFESKDLLVAEYLRRPRGGRCRDLVRDRERTSGRAAGANRRLAAADRQSRRARQ